MLILCLALIIFVLESSLLKIFSSFIPALIILAFLLSFFGFLLNESKSYKERGLMFFLSSCLASLLHYLLGLLEKYNNYLGFINPLIDFENAEQIRTRMLSLIIFYTLFLYIGLGTHLVITKFKMKKDIQKQ
jgi:hypothetical protein